MKTHSQKQTIEKPRFVQKSELSKEQLTDPDYALKAIMKLNGSFDMANPCSKCHHCR